MSQAQTFIDALRRLEADGDAEPLAGLHTPDAAISNPLVAAAHQGPEGARRFWTHYREAFGEIRSHFDHVVETDDVVLLEWRSDGTVGGQRVHYRGVSVVEFAGGRISAFRTYFDTRHLGAQLGAAQPA